MCRGTGVSPAFLQCMEIRKIAGETPAQRCIAHCANAISRNRVLKSAPKLCTWAEGNVRRSAPEIQCRSNSRSGTFLRARIE